MTTAGSDATPAKSSRPVRLAYVLSHPIQYQSPLLRRIAQEPDIDLTVLYTSDFSVRGYMDHGFGQTVEWDVPLLDGYKYEFLPRLRDGSEITFARPLNYGILRALRRGQYDAVWVHGYATLNSLHALLAARLIGARTLLRSDSTLADRPRGAAKQAVRSAFFAALSALVDCVLTVGAWNSDYYRRVLPRVPQVRMPYAVDNAWFVARAESARPQREQLRASLGLEPGRPIILFAAKLLERKRAKDLLEAYIRLSPDGVAQPQPYLLIAGDGEERPALEERVKELNWESIRFLGFQNQSALPALLELCDVFCLPSVFEPWGLAINEAMAVGRAVIVSDQAGCAPDLVADGGNGFVIPAGDIPALAAALARVTREPGLAASMGAAGLTRIQQFDFQADVDALRKALGKDAR